MINDAIVNDNNQLQKNLHCPHIRLVFLTVEFPNIRVFKHEKGKVIEKYFLSPLDNSAVKNSTPVSCVLTSNKGAIWKTFLYNNNQTPFSIQLVETNSHLDGR